MSKHPLDPNVRSNHNGGLTLAVLLLGSLALTASAQSRPVAGVAPEKHFTIPAGVRTPVVLQTQPDAACDLHPAGVSDPSQTMRLYGNIEGYVQFHFTPKQDTQDAYLQLDCSASGSTTTHPLHLRIAASPTADMPAPEASVPVPAGSKSVPALTDETARQLSDEEIIAQGYPSRPNASLWPGAYAKWLKLVSRPTTMIPSHSVSRSDVSHGVQGVTEGPANNSHWSGFAVTGVPFAFWSVSGAWAVPSVAANCSYCYSSAWVGFDGAPGAVPQNVLQAGTEMDSVSMGSGTGTNYYAWHEAYPQEPTAQQVSNLSAGEQVYVYVYVGDSNGNVDPVGGDYGWFLIQNLSKGQTFVEHTKLGTSFGFFSGTSVEWIVERPLVNNGFPQLSDYGSLQMSAAEFLPIGMQKVIPYSDATNMSMNILAITEQIQQLTMTGSDIQPYRDNNVMSTVTGSASCASCMTFTFKFSQ